MGSIPGLGRPTGRKSANPEHHDRAHAQWLWAAAAEPTCCSGWSLCPRARALQQGKPLQWETLQWRAAPLTATRESPLAAAKTRRDQKNLIKKNFNYMINGSNYQEGRTLLGLFTSMSFAPTSGCGTSKMVSKCCVNNWMSEWMNEMTSLCYTIIFVVAIYQWLFIIQYCIHHVVNVLYFMMLWYLRACRPRE